MERWRPARTMTTKDFSENSKENVMANVPYIKKGNDKKNPL